MQRCGLAQFVDEWVSFDVACVTGAGLMTSRYGNGYEQRLARPMNNHFGKVVNGQQRLMNIARIMRTSASGQIACRLAFTTYTGDRYRQLSVEPEF